MVYYHILGVFNIRGAGGFDIRGSGPELSAIRALGLSGMHVGESALVMRCPKPVIRMQTGRFLGLSLGIHFSQFLKGLCFVGLVRRCLECPSHRHCRYHGQHLHTYIT